MAKEINQNKPIKIEKIMNLALENAGAAIGIADFQGNISYVNKAFLKLSKYDNKDEIIGKKIFEFGEANLVVEGVIENVMRYGSYNLESFFKDKNGELIDSDITVNIIKGEKDEPLGLMATFIDITRKTKAEEELKLSELRFENALKSAPFGAHYYNFEESGKLVFFGSNPAADRILGIDHKPLYGKDILEAFPGLAETDIPAQYRKVAATGEQFNRDTVYYDLDAIVGAFEIKAFQTAKNKMAVLFSDITERKKLEAKELEIKNRLTWTLKSIGDAVISTDRNGLIRDMNLVAEEMTGWKTEDALGKPIDEVFIIKNALTGEKAENPVEQVLEKGIVIGLANHTVLTSKDGTDYQIADSAAPIKNIDDEIVGVVLVFRNVTEEYKMREVVRESEELYRLLAENSNDVVWLYNIKDDRTEYVSPSVYALRGYTPEEIISKPMEFGIVPDLRDKVRSWIQELIISGNENNNIHNLFEIEQPRKDGTKVWSEISVKLILDENNRPVKILGVSRDISERKKFETAFNSLVRGTSGTGENFFQSFALEVYSLLKTRYILVGELTNIEEDKIRTLVLCENGRIIDNIEYNLNNTPCKNVVGKKICWYSENIQKRFPKDIMLQEMGAESYVGWLLFDSNKKPVGLMVILDDKPMAENQVITTVFNIFANRAASEIERLRTERNLREVSDQWQATFDSVNDVIWVLDRDARIVLYNKATTEVFGNKFNEFTGKHCWEVVHDSLHPVKDCPVVKMQATKQRQVLVMEREGRWYRVSADPIFDKTGYITGAVHIVSDITDQKSTADNVLKLKQELEYSLDVTNSSTFDNNFITQEVKVSPAMYRYLGYEPEEMPKNFEEGQRLIHQDDMPKLIDAVVKHISMEEKTYFVDYRMKSKSGEWVWVSSEGVISERDERGEPIRLTGISTVIDEKKKIEESLNQKTKELNTFFNTALDLMCIADTYGYFRRLNPEWEKTLGFSLKDLEGRKFIELIHPEDIEATKEKMAELDEQKPVLDFVNRYRCKDGSYRWIEWRAIPSGNLIHAAARDITQRKQFEIELKAAKDKAEESDLLKSAFLTNMSHEIRTPMNAILGFSELLDGPEITQEKRNHYVKLVNDSGRQLLGIINDILDISKIETKQVIVFEEEICINNMMLDLYSHFKPKATDINLSLYYYPGLDDDKATIITDADKLKLIVKNLLSNAVKFTNKGSISFGYSLNPSNDNEILFYVKDTGIGIPTDMHEVIFERFRQVSSSRTRKHAGTGLGLSICKGFVESLKGKMWIKSEEKVGSEFYFTIPYKPSGKKSVSSNKTQTELTKKEESITILIAEDEEVNFLFMEAVFYLTDYIVLHAKNGKEAVEICRSNPGISLILMDIKMPVMDGLEATKLIRETNKTLPIIGITAFALSEDKAKVFEAGCDNFLPKPAEKNAILEMVGRYLK